MLKSDKDENILGIHIPIMRSEIINLLDIKSEDTVVDCTVNRGGHSLEFVKMLNEKGILICNDLDADALEEARENIQTFQKENSNFAKIFFVNDNFSEIKNNLEKLNIQKVDKIFADLGVSSQEIDISGRGFTFMRDEPLLMTFASDVNEDVLTAKDIVNLWGEKTIADILYNFSDERYSRRIAKAIIEYREKKEIETTFELVNIIKKATPFAYHRLKTHFATRTFQALRMAANNELGAIEKLLKSSVEILNEKGRIAILTFHSTEDRLVKNLAKELNLKPVNKKAIQASDEEIKINIRSRSAKLRVYENQQ